MNSNKKDSQMSSAPFIYDNNNAVAWNKMWDTFCYLAVEGGPPHRGTKLVAKGKANGQHTRGYKQAVKEILRAYALLLPYQTTELEKGWIGIKLLNDNMAKWFETIINAENVECKRNGSMVLVPVNDDFSLKKEIKNVVTVVAKAYHYWKNHRNSAEKFYILLFGVDVRWKYIHNIPNE